MNRQALSPVSAIRRHAGKFALLAVLGLSPGAPLSSPRLAAGEQPGPGLEIFDANGGVDAYPGPGVQYPTDVQGSAPYVSPVPTQPEYYQGADVYQGEVYSDPYYQPQGQTYTDPFAAQSAEPYTDPYAQTQPDPYAATTGQDDGGYDDAGGAAGGDTASEYVPPDPRTATLNNLNTRNPHFPGLDAAQSQGDLRGAGEIVWNVLRERRVVNATMARGPLGSVGQASSFEFQNVLSAVNYSPATSPGGESPMAAAARINVILDGFDSPLIDDYGFGSYMEQALIRLNTDIWTVRDAMADVTNDSEFQELTRTYIRAASTCDFFNFERRQLAEDINRIMVRAAPLFYPDGASIGGDVGGVTGNLIQDLLMLDFYTRDDSRFRRNIGSAWRALERPARFIIDTSMPDMSVPRFGPRGSRELSAADVVRLHEMYPRSMWGVNRIGLAASHSFPDASNRKSYGGIFVTRSGPESNARYAAIRFGPLGNLCEVPPHYDFGSLELMSRNIKFVIDPGGYGGDSSAAWAHSGLSIDNENVLGSSYNEPAQPVDTIWRTNASLDYASDMATFADGKTWQRTLLYVKNLPGESRADYWVVLDHVDMKDDNQPHQIRVRYQLAPGIQAYSDGSGILASAGYVEGSALRFFAVDANADMQVTEGAYGLSPSHIYDVSGGTYSAPSVLIGRRVAGDSTTATVLYPAESTNHRPVRIERDSDIIRGRTGAIIIDHGMGRVDVVAWAPPGTELVTPTLNLQMAADLAVFRIRNGKFVRMNFVNLERFQAKEPDGGIWSMRVNGPAQTLTLEPEQHGGWQILSDPANAGSATLYEINLGPAIAKRRTGIRPGDMRIIVR